MKKLAILPLILLLGSCQIKTQLQQDRIAWVEQCSELDFTIKQCLVLVSVGERVTYPLSFEEYTALKKTSEEKK